MAGREAAVIILRWGLFMGLFFTDSQFSVEQILGEKVAQTFFDHLIFSFRFLTEHQVQDYFRSHCPPGATPREFHRAIRSLLHKLTEAKYLAEFEVTLLPPITITDEPLLASKAVRTDLPQVPDDDQIRASRLALKRVPALANHKPDKLYCVTELGCDFVRDLEHKESYLFRGLREQECYVRELVSRHHRAEAAPEPSAAEIANTGLTAMVNLNQLIFTGTYRPLFEAGRISYSAKSLATCRDTVAFLENKDEGSSVRLYFLGPLLPDQLCDWVKHENPCANPQWLWWM